MKESYYKSILFTLILFFFLLVPISFVYSQIDIEVGNLSGRVTDLTTGNPIQGAKVYVLPSIDHGSGQIKIIDDTLGKIKQFFDETDGNGEYLIENIPAGFVTVIAKVQGYIPVIVDAQILSGQTIILNFELNPCENGATGNLSGIVVDAATGLPIQGAKVSVRLSLSIYCLTAPGFGDKYSAETNESGAYEITDIPVGSYVIAATAKGYQTGTQEVTIENGITTQLNFLLKPCELMGYGSVSGRVINANTNEPIAGAKIFLKASSNSAGCDLLMSKAMSDASGYYKFERIPEGIYQIGAIAEGYGLFNGELKVEADQITEFNISLKPKFNFGAGTIIGTVLDSNKLPVSEAKVRIFGRELSTFTDNNGKFTFEKVPTGKVIVVAEKSGVGSGKVVVDVNDGQISEVTIILNRMMGGFGSIHGIVLTTEGKPVAEAKVRIDGKEFSAFTDTDGKFTFKDVPVGKVTVLAEKTGFGSGQAVAEVMDGQITEVTIVLGINETGYGTITGIVINSEKNPVAEAKVRIDGKDFSAFTNSEGRFTFEKVPAGKVTILAEKTGIGNGKTETEVMDGQISEVVIILNKTEAGFGTIKGIIIDSEKNPVAEATVRIYGKDMTTYSNNEGEFTFENVPVGIYKILAEKAGIGSGMAEVEVKDGQISEVTIILSKTETGYGSLKGVVLNAEENPVPEARVNIKGKDLKTYTDNEGKFTFENVPVGNYIVLAEKTGVGSGQAEVQIKDGQISEVRIILKSTGTGYGTIKGIVLNSEKNPVAEAKVRIDGKEFSTFTDTNGKFIFENVPVGKVTVLAEKTGVGSGSTVVEVLNGQISEVTITLTKTETGYGTIKGIILDLAGNPVNEAKVRIYGKEITTYSNGEGRFTFENVPVGSYKILAEKAGVGSGITEVTVKEGQISEVTITLKPVK
jgi:large repetitive protein